MSKRNRNTIIAAIAAILIFRRLGSFTIGTTLFGQGTKINLSKPIESLANFIRAVEEEQSAGFKGSIKPKGLIYRISPGDQYRKNEVWEIAGSQNKVFPIEDVRAGAPIILTNFEIDFQGVQPIIKHSLPIATQFITQKGEKDGYTVLNTFAILDANKLSLE